MKKILVIGGAGQGKTQWVQEHFPEYQRVDIGELLRNNQDGMTMSEVLVQPFHLIMKDWLKEERDYHEAVALLRKSPSWLVISDEIGNGIVPLERADRAWRESTGRMLCELAKDADEVYRIFCGIPTRIK